MAKDLTIKESFEKWIGGRIDFELRGIVTSNKAFIEAQEEADKYYNAFKQTLPKESLSAYLEYEQKQLLVYAIEVDTLFKQAFKDGFNLRKLLEV